jgi:predicted glycogen debranching enzyme
MSLADPLLKTPVIPQEVCRDFARSSRLEWLDTNHTGAFAMGTVAGVNTRRYHSLLLATLNPPADRYCILPCVAETVTLNDNTFQLSAFQYPGVVHPRGFETLTEFTTHPFPTWSHQCGAALVTKSVCLLDNQQAVLVRYQTTAECRLSVKLFLAYRDYHSLSHQNGSFNATAKETAGALVFQPYTGLPALTILHNSQQFQSSVSWSLKHEYLRELERGLDFQEDLCSPGSLFFDLKPNQPAYFVATLEPDTIPCPLLPRQVEALIKHETARRTFPNRLVRSLDQFQVRRLDGQPTLMAGYPWFTDWSRDTLISLPALTAAGFPSSTTKAILEMLLSEKKQGILPNRFSDMHSAPEFNTVDASLWFFIAAHAHLNATDDFEFLKDVVYPAALNILQWHFRGTFFNIHADPADQLLSAGSAHVQLTWMDAKIGDEVVTPRTGKPVEINALWYNALQITAHWALSVGDAKAAEDLTQKARAVYASFNLHFWNSTRGCLYDVLTPAGPDESVRPNQIFALSLPFPLLSRERAQSVMKLVRSKLLTRVGLRTLEPGHPLYKPRFEGDMRARDRAYHQGTVWPWLIGPFLSAWLYAFGEQAETLAECRGILQAMLAEFDACCLGSFSEVYDAEFPHRPAGCPAQLWSVAQILLAAQRIQCLPDA